MGMMLRRKDRKAADSPKVNGKPVNQEPKKKSLTENKNAEERAKYSQYRN